MFGNPETPPAAARSVLFVGACGHSAASPPSRKGDRCKPATGPSEDRQEQGGRALREAEFDILYGEGISREGDVLDLAVANNIVEKSGAWYSYAGERIGQGRENTRAFLKENKESSPRWTPRSARNTEHWRHQGGRARGTGRRPRRSQGSRTWPQGVGTALLIGESQSQNRDLGNRPD